MILTIILPATLLTIITSVFGNDYFKHKHNKKLKKKMDREAEKLRKKILKRTKNVKDKFLKNIMINSEIDNYVFKSQYKIKTFTTKKRSQNELNIILRLHYYIFQKLKYEMMDREIYDKIKHNKRDEIVKYITELDTIYNNIETEQVREFIYYHEHLLLHYHEEVEELFQYCNNGHIFIGLQKHPSPTRKVLGLFH